MARIVATGTALPPHRLDADGFREALRRAFAPLVRDVRPLLRMAANCGVRERHLVRSVDETLRPVPLGERNAVYAEAAVELGTRAARVALERAGVEPREIDLVITTSCTGYMLPSLDACLVETLGLRPGVRRLPITELGCLAGASALCRAADLVDGGRFRTALVIAVEFPSLTFQPGDGSMDNVVSTLVFADGAGAAVLRQDPGPGFELVDSRAAIMPGTLDEMGFVLKSDGFHVVLTRDVPELLAEPFRETALDLLGGHGLSVSDLGFACIHPGGPKILRAVDAVLGAEGLTAPSWEALARFGNQSSVAVLTVLDLLFERTLSDGSIGLLAGFGPGLSLELGLLVRRG